MRESIPLGCDRSPEGYQAENLAQLLAVCQLSPTVVVEAKAMTSQNFDWEKVLHQTQPLKLKAVAELPEQGCLLVVQLWWRVAAPQGTWILTTHAKSLHGLANARCAPTLLEHYALWLQSSQARPYGGDASLFDDGTLELRANWLKAALGSVSDYLKLCNQDDSIAATTDALVHVLLERRRQQLPMTSIVRNGITI